MVGVRPVGRGVRLARRPTRRVAPRGRVAVAGLLPFFT